MSLKLFNFVVHNTLTKEKAAFTGQGESMAEAWRDAVKNIDETESRLNVFLPTKRNVCRTVAEFEGDVPFGESKPAVAPQPEILDL
jgi:hypothetical protein